MSGYVAALWAETLKARRSLLPWLAVGAYSLAPLAGGLFMVILKDPEHARDVGLVGQKARLAAGTADWPALLGLLGQMVAAAGGVLSSVVAAWVFGREFSDRTVRTLLALPTARWAVVAAKATVVATWSLVASAWVLALGLGVGWLVDIPGFTLPLLSGAVRTIAVVVVLNVGLQAVTALIASAGRGYLAPIGWTFLSLAIANLFAVLGGGRWFPWAVPALLSGVAGPDGEVPGTASFVLVAMTALGGLAGTLTWWERADQAG